MLLPLLCSLSPRPTQEQHRKWVQYNHLFSTLASSFSLLLSFRLQLPDFGRGFLVGLAISFAAGSLYFTRLLKDNRKLREHYITTYDERQQLMRRLSLEITALIVMVLIGFLIVLFAFWSLTLPYLVLLLGLVYGLPLIYLLCYVTLTYIL